MITKEGEFELDGELQNLGITNYKFLEIENTSGSNIEISINDGVARTYEPGALYRSPSIEINHLYEDEIKIRGTNGTKINYSYVI
ncbi:MAG: hypothetical protein HUU50_02640 [Candidatus Brocadiae bacterium]|nr:hypothetical protein [Candidatus Brocadiia bacterium]